MLLTRGITSYQIKVRANLKKKIRFAWAEIFLNFFEIFLNFSWTFLKFSWTFPELSRIFPELLQLLVPHIFAKYNVTIPSNRGLQRVYHKLKVISYQVTGKKDINIIRRKINIGWFYGHLYKQRRAYLFEWPRDVTINLSFLSWKHRQTYLSGSK
jgi:hypothetical protein